MSPPRRKQTRRQKPRRGGAPRVFPTMPNEVGRQRQPDGSYLVACDVACPSCGCLDSDVSHPLPEVRCWDCGTVYRPFGDVQFGPPREVGP